MKAKDLVVGDYLLYNGKPYRVMQITGIVGENFMLENGVEDEGEPITLTKDILSMIGFKPFIAGQMLWNKSEDFIVTVLPDLSIYPNSEHRCLVGIRNGYTNAKIALDYLHELQNALRICGINEEIEI